MPYTLVYDRIFYKFCRSYRFAAFLMLLSVVQPFAPKGPHVAGQLTRVPCGTALSAIRPVAKTTLGLQRGCRYRGSLIVRASHVTITAYGTGRRPVITLNRNGATIVAYGSHDTIKNLSLRGVAPRTWRCRGVVTPAGHVDGIDLEPGAADDTVLHVHATGFYAAVYIMAGSTGNLIESNTFNRNVELDTNNPVTSAGAFGVLIWGNHNTVQNNTINNNQACSRAYRFDGSAVEVYGGSHNLIRANKAANDNAFTELGSYRNHVATDNTFNYNIVTDGRRGHSVTFLVTRGSGDSDGPVHDTAAARNRVTLTRADDVGAVSYAWQSGDGSLLKLTDNYLNLGKNRVLYEDGGYINGGGNTFIGTCNHSRDC
jgi:hypothetical protein